MTPRYAGDGWELYVGDCLAVLPGLTGIDAVVTDPPYGIGWAQEFAIMSGGLRVDGTRRHDRTWAGRRESGYERKEWDNEKASEAVKAIAERGPSIIWGGNYYADMLPVSGGWLVWDKGVSMPTLSKCELAWTNVIGHAEHVKILWAGYRKDEPCKREHPTQKPVSLMQWCLTFLPDAKVILDPFAGSASTGVACIKTNRRFIGIEIDTHYAAIAAKRLQRAEADKRNSLPFPDPEPRPKQVTMWEAV